MTHETIFSFSDRGYPCHSFIAYPNPAGRVIHLSLRQNDVGNNVTIFDVIGNIVFTGSMVNNEMDLDLTNYKSGVYLIEIDNKSFKKVLKVVKN